MESQQPRDEQLWKLARKRAGFKRSLITYILINAFLWMVWYFKTGRDTGWYGFPWPMWVLLGWGIGIAFQFFDAYGGGKDDAVEKEYEKLRREKEIKN